MNRSLSIRAVVLAIAILLAGAPMQSRADPAARAKGRIFILNVWDGLRPDLVTPQTTPNLYALEREGVRFAKHHSVYPTLTMVNAAALSTGATPALDGILGNDMYLAPALGAKLEGDAEIARLAKAPLSLETTKLLSDLNGPAAFAGRLLGLDTIAQELEREGGYLAVVGKKGPTFICDNRVLSLRDGRDSLQMPHKDYLFLADDAAEPEAFAHETASALKILADKNTPTLTSDSIFTKVIVDKAIPAAKAASDQGRTALVVFWQHDPDWTQHHSGLGTAQALAALRASDDNLGRIRAAIAHDGIDDRTDLMVVSDHGFATIRMRIDLGGLLLAAGLKKSVDSSEMMIVRNGGTDFIHLSPDAFASDTARRAILQKIVDFAEAQEWCGPIFSRIAAPAQDGNHRRFAAYLGWIDGTFSEAAVGLDSPARAPDLAISFREYPDLDNSNLTGPANPAFALGAQGQTATRNLSAALVTPVKGLLYADAPGAREWSTGLGMHGAAGMRELHNYCAAVGPDFRRGFIDNDPTGNSDVAPTISSILHLLPNLGPGGVGATGRVLSEAVSDGHATASPRAVEISTSRELQGMKVLTTLMATRFGNSLYLDDSSVEHIPLGRGP